MGVPANTAITYSNVGIREDLSDVIYRVAPEETPFTNNIGTGKATATFHEWQTENLASVDTGNAVLEGDDATIDAANIPARLGNRTQISDKTASVSGTNDEVNKAGRNTEMARQVMLKGMELARDIEAQMLSNQASNAGAAGTARVSAGMESWIVTNASRGSGGSGGGFSGGTVAAPTDGTQRAFTEALLKAAQLAAFNAGGKPTQLYMAGGQKQIFSGLAAPPHVRTLCLRITAMALNVSYWTGSANQNVYGLPIGSEDVAISGVSAQSGGTPNNARYVRLVAGEATRVLYATNPTALATSIAIPSGGVIDMDANPGWKVAGIAG